MAHGRCGAYLTIAGALALPLPAEKALADNSAPTATAPAAPLRGTMTPLAIDVASGPNPQTGLPVYGFLVYPSVFVGGVYNSNVYQTGNGQVGSGGFEITPSVTAVNDQGVHKTTLTLNADASFYPAASRPSPTTGQSPTNVTGTVIADHNWRPANDLTVDILGAFVRQNGIFGAFGSAGPSFVTSTVLATSAGSQQYWNELAGVVSVEKSFADRWSLRGGVAVEAIGYNPPPANAIATSQSNVNYNAFVRASYGITPVIRGFVEVDGGLSNYQGNLYNSDTYRVVAGLNSDMIGLFRGEVYAGFQKQFSLNNAFASGQAPAFGATLFYYPTRALTVAASVEQGFGSATAVRGSNPASATATGGGDTLQARLEADYNLSNYWTAALRAGWARTTWLYSPLIETAWTLGGSLNYNFWRNFSMTLNYQYTWTGANQSGIYAYAQNLISAGITYRY